MHTILKMPQNITYANGRFFIDITSSGCGSACSYCYVRTSKDPQTLISEKDLKTSLNYILSSEKYLPGKNGSIISLCPNSEPLKSNNSIQLIINILDCFLPKKIQFKYPQKN